MNNQSLTKLGTGRIFRYDMKKFLLSQMGTLFALIYIVASEGHPPFGRRPYQLLSLPTVLLLINIGVFGLALIRSRSHTIRLFPSMLIFSGRGRETRVDFGRLLRLELVGSRDLVFFITGPDGREMMALKISGFQVYSEHKELLSNLQHLLGSRFVTNPIGIHARRKAG